GSRVRQRRVASDSLVLPACCSSGRRISRGSSLVPTTGRRHAPTSRACATGSAAGWARARGHAPSQHDERMRILVLGTERSGTTWVARALASADDATYVHEPDNADANPLATAAKHDL